MQLDVLGRLVLEGSKPLLRRGQAGLQVLDDGVLLAPSRPERLDRRLEV